MLESTAPPCTACVLNILCPFPTISRAALSPTAMHGDELFIFTLINSMSPHLPELLGIWKISCFNYHAGNFSPAISHSVFFFAPLPCSLSPFSPSLTHFHSLWHCFVNIKWAPSILLNASQAQMISLREYGVTATNYYRLVEEVYGTVTQVIATSTFPFQNLYRKKQKADGSVAVGFVCAEVPIREPGAEGSALRSGNQAVLSFKKAFYTLRG